MFSMCSDVFGCICVVFTTFWSVFDVFWFFDAIFVFWFGNVVTELGESVYCVFLILCLFFFRIENVSPMKYELGRKERRLQVRPPMSFAHFSHVTRHTSLSQMFLTHCSFTSLSLREHRFHHSHNAFTSVSSRSHHSHTSLHLSHLRIALNHFSSHAHVTPAPLSHRCHTTSHITALWHEFHITFHWLDVQQSPRYKISAPSISACPVLQISTWNHPRFCEGSRWNLTENCPLISARPVL